LGLPDVALRGSTRTHEKSLSEDHLAIVDLVGKGRHVRRVPVPGMAACSGTSAVREIPRVTA
jgi:hypothetical protein